MANGVMVWARGLIAAAVVIATASLAYANDPADLANGIPVTGISGAIGSEVFYKIDVPAGQGELQISISGGTGDCDLYVRQGGLPSSAWYDYRPLLFGNNEMVVVSDPASGVWYILLRGHDAYSDVTLLASYTPAAPRELRNGMAEIGLQAEDNTERLYCIAVPAGQSILEVTTLDGSGDVDLYVKYGSAPTLLDFDGRSFGGDADEEVTISDPAAGRWYIMLHAYGTYQGVTLRAVYGTGGLGVPLEDEVPLTDLSGALGSETSYYIDVPRGEDTIAFSLAGGTGNCDMYIKKGARPTTLSWDYRGTASGNGESIVVSGQDPGGRWYVLLVGAQDYSGVTLTADYARSTSPGEDVEWLAAGVPVPDVAGLAASQRYFGIEVPNTVRTLVIQMSGGTGDADLYVRKGVPPTTSQYDYRPYLTNSNERVTVTSSVGGTWFIMIRGYQAFSGVTLLVTFDGVIPEEVATLENGMAVTGLTGVRAGERLFKIEVPADETKLVVSISGGTGDADLYVRLGERPTTRDWDFRPYLMGNKETVMIDEPKAGTCYIMIRGYLAYTGVTLKAAYGLAAEQIKTLENGVPLVSLLGAQDSEMFYKVDVPAGQDLLRIEISGGTGDADLYVKKGEKPTLKDWDYYPALHGNIEKVEIPTPAAGSWYMMLRGYRAYTGVTLQACFQAAVNPNGG